MSAPEQDPMLLAPRQTKTVLTKLLPAVADLGVHLRVHRIEVGDDGVLVHFEHARRILWTLDFWGPGRRKHGMARFNAIAISGTSAYDSWARRHDGSFDIPAIALSLTATVLEEAAIRPSLPVHPGGSTAALAILECVWTAARLIGTVPADDTFQAFQERIEEALDELTLGGRKGPNARVAPAVLKAKAAAAGLQALRDRQFGPDPFKPLGSDIIVMLYLTDDRQRTPPNRPVLLLDRYHDMLTLLDPAGAGVVQVELASVKEEWINAGRHRTILANDEVDDWD